MVYSAVYYLIPFCFHDENGMNVLYYKTKKMVIQSSSSWSHNICVHMHVVLIRGRQLVFKIHFFFSFFFYFFLAFFPFISIIKLFQRQKGRWRGSYRRMSSVRREWSEPWRVFDLVRNRVIVVDLDELMIGLESGLSTLLQPISLRERRRIEWHTIGNTTANHNTWRAMGLNLGGKCTYKKFRKSVVRTLDTEKSTLLPLQ